MTTTSKPQDFFTAADKVKAVQVPTTTRIHPSEAQVVVVVQARHADRGRTFRFLLTQITVDRYGTHLAGVRVKADGTWITRGYRPTFITTYYENAQTSHEGSCTYTFEAVGSR